MSLAFAMTRWPRALVGLVAFVGGAGLLGDMSSWWLARDNAVWINVIVAGGFLYGVATTVLGLAVILDCVLPGGRSKPKGDADGS